MPFCIVEIAAMAKLEDDPFGRQKAQKAHKEHKHDMVTWINLWVDILFEHFRYTGIL